MIRGQSSRGQLSGGHYSSGAIILGGNYPGRNFPRRQLSSGGIVRVGKYPGGNFPRRQLSGHHQKQILRQIEWWVQNRPITKNGVLPVSILFFWEFSFSLRTSYKELIWCTNIPNAHIRIFSKHGNFIGRCFFPLSILNNVAGCKILQNSQEKTSVGVSFLIKMGTEFFSKFIRKHLGGVPFFIKLQTENIGKICKKTAVLESRF